MKNIKSIGVLKAQPSKLGAAESAVKFPKCDNCDTMDVCRDTVSSALGNTTLISGFNYKGMDFSITPTLVTNPSEIAKLSNAEIARYEIDPVVRVSYDGTTFNFTHIGAGTVSHVKRTVGANLTATRFCESVAVCAYEIELEGATDPVVNGTSSANLANSPYTYTGVPATDSATAAQLQTDMMAALTAVGQAYDSVRVLVDSTSGRFKVIVSVVGLAFRTQVGTQKFVSGDCKDELR